MKRQGGLKATVVFVTAHASEEFGDRVLEAGASDFVSKPFNIRRYREVFAEAARCSKARGRGDLTGLVLQEVEAI
jgi:FixJ family two-component response regulator